MFVTSPVASAPSVLGCEQEGLYWYETGTPHQWKKSTENTSKRRSTRRPTYENSASILRMFMLEAW